MHSGRVLGISAYYHDSAAALLVDGRIVAAAQEERFTRKRHDSRFPANAARYCLREGRTEVEQLDAVVFYDKPLVKFERLLETYVSFAPAGLRSFTAAMPVWLKDKLFLKKTLRGELARLASPGAALPKLLFTEHHQSHAASAFFPSPFDRAAVLCLDGVGEWATTSAWLGEGNSLRPLWEIDFPHSLGMLYSAFTYYTGFRVNSGEYKLMGLAPYGEPKYASLILERLLDLKADGTFRLDMRYFEYCTGLTMTNRRFDELFGGPPRAPESKITQRELDLAASIQQVSEEIVLRLARTLKQETGERYLCLAGGVALNCVAIGRVLREGPFDDVWVQPAAGDAGGSLGAALCAWHEYLGAPRRAPSGDAMEGAYLGPAYDRVQVREALDREGAVYVELDEAELPARVAAMLEAQQVIGWFQGRMEFGPRALGSRSILGDPRNPAMQSVMNRKIKHRESFRPFAPAVLAEDAFEYFELDRPSPYMAIVAPIRPGQRVPLTSDDRRLGGLDQRLATRSRLPAITHVDYSARIQTVHRETNPRFHQLLREFKARTGCGVLVNTSFNVRGEPIVATPDDAYRCFMRTELDCLVAENFVALKREQPARPRDEAWKTQFELD